ncbi:MAG: hypothetical protein IT327_03135 [Anaerolineae bacterium]|nr:hypothetical protein [Anaerolineae bacterium]
MEVNVTFKLYEARRMATAVLAYLHAWDVMRMMAYQQSVGQPAPFQLVATASEPNGAPNGTAKPKTGPIQDNGIHQQRADVANGRPVTRKSSGQANGKVASPPNGNSTVKQPPQYGNGTLVDGKNLTEVQTYQQYLAEKQSAPASKTALLGSSDATWCSSGDDWWPIFPFINRAIYLLPNWMLACRGGLTTCVTGIPGGYAKSCWRRSLSENSLFPRCYKTDPTDPVK